MLNAEKCKIIRPGKKIYTIPRVRIPSCYHYGLLIRRFHSLRIFEKKIILYFFFSSIFFLLSFITSNHIAGIFGVPCLPPQILVVGIIILSCLGAPASTRLEQPAGSSVRREEVDAALPGFEPTIKERWLPIIRFIGLPGKYLMQLALIDNYQQGSS